MHLQAEKLNGRAAMMGYVLALFVDKLSGASLLEQQGSFLGLLALHITVFAILAIRYCRSEVAAPMQEHAWFGTLSFFH
jgi:hypothetical protein